VGKALTLGKIFGIDFRVHFSWLFIFALVTFSLVDPFFTEPLVWLTAIIASSLLFASVVAHELAHSLVGRANGIPIVSITLFIFGGVAQMTREAEKPRAELLMAAAGPLCSLALGLVFGAIFLIPVFPSMIREVLFWLAAVNGMLAIFNLVPGFPLDGGRIFRSILWRVTGNYFRASRIAIRAGQVIGFLLISAGILLAIIRPGGINWIDGIWLSFIGWFLANAASASYRQLRAQEASGKIQSQIFIQPGGA